MSVVDLKEKFGEPKVWQNLISYYVLSVIVMILSVVVTPMVPFLKERSFVVFVFSAILIFALWASTLTYSIWAVAITPSSASPIPIFLTLISPLILFGIFLIIISFTGVFAEFYNLLPTFEERNLIR